jgi:hydrogenase maturation protein HypF
VAWVTKTSAPVTADQVSLVSDVIQQGSTDQPASASTRLFPLTSSVGRLFDGVASLLLHIDRATFEGEPAMRLEAACDRSTEGEYELRVTSGELPEIDWRPMIRQILTDLQQGIPVGTIARLFTRTMARAIQRICAGFSDVPLVLSGGCFQNAILTEETLQMLQSHPQPIGQPDCIPVNDGGLAAGQLAVAAAHAAEGRWTHENSSQHSPAREML